MTALVATACQLLLSAAPPALGETYDFIGFSGNEALAAWSVQVVEGHDDGSRDVYGLVLVVDAVSNDLLQVYRDRAPVRYDAEGHPRRVAAARLVADNPRYEGASAESEWKQLRRHARFGSKVLLMDDSAFRLDPDRDVDLEAVAEKKAITAKGAIGSPMGFHGVVRRFDGKLLDVGHFRQEAEAHERIDLEVTVHYSRSGYGVAILNRFRTQGDGGEVRRAALARVVRLSVSPIATVYVGTLGGAYAQMEHAERIFKETHPANAKDYDDFVGTYW